jgi:undecaprenyl-diphosphatase
MDWTQALMLGVIQGLTEFLPVSSSGHLVLGQRLLGLTEPHLLFDVAVHVGTLLAVVVVFADDLRLMAMGLVPGRDRDPGGRRLVILVAVGMVPAAIAGLLFRDAFEALYASTLAVGVALLLTGSMLMLTFLIPNGARNLERGGVPTAFVVGRSGATISVGLALGLGRGSAARLSFLLSIPAILGALVLQLAEVGELAMREVAPLLVGGASAAITGYFALRLLVAITGYFALRLLVRVVQGGKIYLFAFYCWTVGAASIAASLEIW